MAPVTANTPVWVPILVGVIGIIGVAAVAIVSAMITQRRSDQREADGWLRQQEKQQAEWDREDRLRLLIIDVRPTPNTTPHFVRWPRRQRIAEQCRGKCLSSSAGKRWTSLTLC